MIGSLVKNAAGCAVAFMLAVPAMADVQVEFVEGAPKDRFVLRNASDCSLSAATVRLDLSSSQGGLIFDVTGAGAGVEVFQPFEMVSGSEYLNGLPQVQDGQSMVDLDIRAMPPGAEIAFTIDVDDTGGGREITVSGAEIQGATVSLEGAQSPQRGVFSSAARAAIPVGTC
ncbi:aggregation factor core [Ruegeria arenilitoris]|uniref:aggregation factor core n=1 Tax=Ruegeria arenilitoris TaxID=1173585 RepID=UPI00147E5F2F|nr:aggregation factor core [Ruegeria arenilitoris]